MIWFEATYGEYIKSLRVSSAGLPRHGRKGAIQWNMMKGQGVQKGESDIALCVPRGGYGAMMIEHKGKGMTHKTTKEQQDYLDHHNKIGNFAISTRGLPELIAAVSTYMDFEYEKTPIHT